MELVRLQYKGLAYPLNQRNTLHMHRCTSCPYFQLCHTLGFISNGKYYCNHFNSGVHLSDKLTSKTNFRHDSNTSSNIFDSLWWKLLNYPKRLP